MSELDTLRPEVRSHIQTMDAVMADSMYHPEWRIIRAELLRLAAENTELHKAAARGALAHMKAEAELAALRARIAGSQECDVVALCGGGTSLSHEPRESLVGKRVRLLVDEPQDDNAKEGRG